MNILFFSSIPFYKGGVNTFLRNLAIALESRGHTVSTLTWRRWRGQTITGEFKRLEVVSSALLIHLGRVDTIILNRIPLLLLASRQARKIVNTSDIDVIQSSDIYDGWAAGLAKSRRIPLITTVQGDYPVEMQGWVGHGKRAGLHRWLFNRMEKLTLKYSDAITTPSDWLRNKLSPRFGDTPSVAIPNGVFLPSLKPNPGLKERLELPSDRKIIATMNDVYTPDRVMGFDLTLQAFSKILINEPTALLVLVGGLNPDMLSRAKEKAKGLPVLFTGSIPNSQALDIVSCCDVYVQSTYPYLEGFSIANMEAMSFGKPVVAPADAAIPEYLEHGVNGLLIPPHLDSLPNNMAASVTKLLQDAELRARLGEEARKTVAQRYTWEHIAQEFEELYLSCCGKGNKGVERSRK